MRIDLYFLVSVILVNVECMRKLRIIYTELPLKQNGSVQILSPSLLDHLEQFSFCARFKTFRFLDFNKENYVSRQIVLVLGGKNPFLFYSKVKEKKQGGRKHIEGCIAFEGKEVCRQVWRPNIWNKFCLMLDVQYKKILLSINERQSLFNISYNSKPDVNGNGSILMLNGQNIFWGQSFWPMYGAVTDVHVWDRLIDEVEEYPLSNTNHTPGNIISWQTAEVKTNLLIEDSEILFLENPQFEVFRKVTSLIFSKYSISN